ncbi:hypothetical protein A7E78_10985 [Syntrophotalea acetylenivorans]|uniref:Uncharacterized protein n=1 Tax=Syntrophotalea acetylenivorans TaxID=1842532 RepID=A0A1L3GQX9_9BACT|nr:hypothetical protein [Syntrophotalea acetylenivorans]APG28327.1 hypothetical protein A7E78_10985 [Syntrophotalea acetylenivorans]
MNQEEILNFITTLDHRLLAAAAVFLLLFLLFWRVLRRTSRIEREVARLNERLERIREEVRSIAEPNPLSVAPAKEVPATIKTEQAPPEEPDLIEEQPEEEDVLSRAAASLAEANAEEDRGTADSDTDFSFDQTFADDPNELDAAVEESSTMDNDTFSFGEPEEAPAPVEETVVPAAAEPELEPEKAPSGVVSLEGDPARPGVSMVRCLSCNYKLAYPEKLSGKRVRCPSCRTGLDLP